MTFQTEARKLGCSAGCRNYIFASKMPEQIHLQCVQHPAPECRLLLPGLVQSLFDSVRVQERLVNMLLQRF